MITQFNNNNIISTETIPIIVDVIIGKPQLKKRKSFSMENAIKRFFSFQLGER
jgi:hypothetical protein